MKPFSSWPLVSAICTLAGVVVSVAKTQPDDDIGHPLPSLTAKAIEVSAYYGCTNLEIANYFMISESYLLDHFGANLEFIRARRSYDLRKAQFELAVKKGNGPMLTWLGRNELGQSLHSETPDEPLPLFPPKVG